MVDVSATLIIQLMNFGALVFILYAVLFKPLVKFLDKRSGEIKDEIEGAESRNVQAGELVKKYEEKIKKVEKEAETFMESVKHDALKEKDKILRSAEAESQAIVDRAKKEIAAECENARNGLKKEFASMALQCASKIVEKEITEQDHVKMIEDFLQSELN